VKTAFPYWFAMVLVAQLTLLGCASTGGGERKLEVGTEKSFDGLVEVTNSRASKAWVRPDFDLSGYTRVRLEGAGIELRPVSSRSRSSRSSGEGQLMSQAAQTRLVEIMRKAFETELSRSEHFELTDEVGPDVLTVWGGLLDVVSFIPPQRAGRDNLFLSRVGEATLVIELRDSETNATLMRIMDRQAVNRPMGDVRVSNTVTNSADVRRLANRWARLFRQRLDEVPQLSNSTDPLE
jgi:hypothetical protein